MESLGGCKCNEKEGMVMLFSIGPGSTTYIHQQYEK